MTSKTSNTQAEMRKAAEDKLKAERNKYFVPSFGEIEATDTADLEEKVAKLNEKEEDGDASSR